VCRWKGFFILQKRQYPLRFSLSWISFL